MSIRQTLAATALKLVPIVECNGVWIVYPVRGSVGPQC